MSVLSGPAAAALYGSSAAQGVILITTKKGKEGKVKLEYSNSTTFSNPFIMPRFQSEYGNQPGSFKSWGLKGSALPYDPVKFFNTGTNIINSIALTTGTDKNQTYISAATTNAAGILPNNKYNRYNFTIRNSTKFLGDKLTLDLGAQYILQDQKNMVAQGYYYNPLPALYLYPRGENFDEVRQYEVYDEARNVSVQNWRWGNGGIDMENPYWQMYRKNREQGRERYMLNGSLKWKVASWIDLTGRIRVDNSIVNSRISSMQAPIPTGRVVVQRDVMVRVSPKKSRCMLMLWQTSTRASVRTTASLLTSGGASPIHLTTRLVMVDLSQMSLMALTYIM